ncbi:hypothetical protein RUM43_002070 [Polyplax serrata]|uniref:Uncharacterized protein n=1 Tax=Polyplax serrata TaxID=468196 RepID=A0AAN8PC28_POLSC
MRSKWKPSGESRYSSGSSDEEVDCDVTTQSSEEDEEEDEELMEEMTRGPSVEQSDGADDLSLLRGGKEAVESVKGDGRNHSADISENSVSTTSPSENSPRGRETDGRKSSPELSQSENSFTPTDQRQLNSASVTPSNRLNYNYFRNPDDSDTPVRHRSSSDHLDISKALRVVPKELKLRETGRGIWAREKIPKGTKYGPFLGKWTTDPIDPRFAWEAARIGPIN